MMERKECRAQRKEAAEQSGSVNAWFVSTRRAPTAEV